MNRPTAWYNKRTRMWALQLSKGPTTATYLRDETGDIRYFLTAQDAYDAYAAKDTP